MDLALAGSVALSTGAVGVSVTHLALGGCPQDPVMEEIKAICIS